MNTKEWLRQYLGEEKGNGSIAFAGIFALIGGIFLLCVPNGDTFLLLLAMSGIAGGGYMVTLPMRNKSGSKNWIQTMEREGRLPAILEDFQNASDFFGGYLRMGQRWCFGKGSLVPIMYTDIVRVYQHVHKTNFIEDDRSLIAVTTSGATKIICKLPVGGSGDQELNQVLNIMLGKNPNIHIGYQK